MRCYICVFFLLNNESIYVKPNTILRGNYGTEKTAYNIKMNVENLINNLEMRISVSGKKYTKDEIEKIFTRKINEIKVNMLGENESYESVNSKLNFKIDVGDGIKANYVFTPELIKNEPNDGLEDIVATNSEAFNYYVKYQNLIDGSGNVKNDNFEIDEVCNGYIEIRLQGEIKEQESIYKSEKYLIYVTVVSRELSPIESFKNAYIKNFEKRDKDSVNSDTVELPNRINGLNIKYKEKRNLTFLIMPILGIMAALLLEARDKEKIKDEEKLKKRTLEIDFGQIISKILLYVSSGMTIRNSMIRLANDYQSKLMKNDIKRRVAYDEIVIVKNKLNSGYSEISAYEEMAKNINMRIYTRFLNIIIQSIKNGNKELKSILNMEVQDALYERKQRAKKMGEEAATKLILPLMMMLAIIMIVIMVPAFMGM